MSVFVHVRACQGYALLVGSGTSLSPPVRFPDGGAIVRSWQLFTVCA